MDLHFHIQTPGGRSLAVAFPGELSARQLLSELVTDDEIALQSSDPAAWHLLDVAGKPLDPNKTLLQNGVAGGQHLQLSRKKNGPKDDEKEGKGDGGSRVLTRCENGHYYDAKKHTKCPYCAVAAIDFGPKSLRIESVSDEHTRPAGAKVAPTTPGVGDDAPTRQVRLVSDTARIDPVVGWLVNVGGPEKGKDYRIRSENNTIGRSKDMYICISGDDSISRERHTVITFDPQRNAFHLSPGEGRGLVYLNGEALLAHKQLAPYDVILLGKTKLVFVPFCGEKFKWE